MMSFLTPAEPEPTALSSGRRRRDVQTASRRMGGEA